MWALRNSIAIAKIVLKSKSLVVASTAHLLLCAAVGISAVASQAKNAQAPQTWKTIYETLYTKDGLSNNKLVHSLLIWKVFKVANTAQLPTQHNSLHYEPS